MAYTYDAERHQTARLNGINERIKAGLLELNRLNQAIFEVEDRAARAQAKEAVARNNQARIEKQLTDRAVELEQTTNTLNDARSELKKIRQQKQQATRGLKATNERLARAGQELESTRQETQNARAEAEAAQAHAIHIRTKLAMHLQKNNVATDAISYAENAYMQAMKTHPDDALQGPRRLRQLNQEVAAASRTRTLKAVS